MSLNATFIYSVAIRARVAINLKNEQILQLNPGISKALAVNLRKYSVISE
jgi:hypothetical protein